MAEIERVRGGAAQDTGNPVLDSLVNIVAGVGGTGWRIQSIENLHNLLIKLAEKEPKGLVRRLK